MTCVIISIDLYSSQIRLSFNIHCFWAVFRKTTLLVWEIIGLPLKWWRSLVVESNCTCTCRHLWHAALRLRSAIRRHHVPQRAVLSQICCFGERIRWCWFRSCWTVLSHVMRERPGCLLQSAGVEANRILLASALSSMRIIYLNRVSRRDWIIAVSLGCFVSLRTSSLSTNNTIWRKAAYADTTGRVHRSYVRPS